MMECWNSKVFQYRRTGACHAVELRRRVLARTCAGEDACTPEGSNSFPPFPYSIIPI
jgi:hypothetical protein